LSKIEMRGGIMAEPFPGRVGEDVYIRYAGLLAQSGADKMYLHLGYGDQWNDVNDYEMKHSDQGWETRVKITRAGPLNFCFKDRADNWDNNNGHNWTYQIDPNRFR